MNPGCLNLITRPYPQPKNLGIFLLQPKPVSFNPYHCPSVPSYFNLRLAFAIGRVQKDWCRIQVPMFSFTVARLYRALNTLNPKSNPKVSKPLDFKVFLSHGPDVRMSGDRSII